ncbi:uncharacterized protein LOC124363279 isoform X2 [Homalodisca vitripennis]|uniref:uncharacterized protein LOC124363279 isoform X2 n=1 Tax=Homalodisca vitripennis TaxID=197043 RepID=UPI001EEC9CA8|nr:uncharacterized protein LOC124363279 isoform X2 [Homalodisca vitripennis]
MGNKKKIGNRRHAYKARKFVGKSKKVGPEERRPSTSSLEYEIVDDNEVESKKRKTTKSAPKKVGWKKKTAAVTVGDSQHVTCCALACTNTSESCTLVSLPTDPHLREQWLHNIDRQDWTPSQDSMLCQIHFEPDLWEEDKDGKKSLKPDAVPSLFLHGETIQSWVTLDREGNVNNVLVRDGIMDEKKDCDESIDIEESDVYIKQEALEPEIDVNCDESSDPSTTFQATFVGPKQEQIDDIKPPVITVSSFHSCEPETIVPEIVPVVIKSEPMEEEEETTSAAVDDTSKDDEHSKGWKCTSLGCDRIFRNKDKMELHAKRKHSLDDKVNGGNLVTIKEENQNSTFGLLSLDEFPTPVVSANTVTAANWPVLPTHSPPGMTSTKVITAPINSQTGDPLGTKKYLVMIPTQSTATVGGMTGLRPPQPSLLPVLVPSPTPSLSPSPTSPQVTPPLEPPSVDSSETLTIDLSQFDERTRVGLKKKILELLDAVEKRKLNPDNLAIVYYNSDKNRSLPDEEGDSDVEAPSAKKRKSGKTAKK